MSADLGEMWIVNVNGCEYKRVLAASEQDAYDVAEQIWDAQHFPGSFDRQTVGVVLVVAVWERQ